MALIGVLLALILGTGARPILLALGGAQYLDAANVLRIQGIALITVFVSAAWNTTLIGMNRTRALALCSAIGVAAVALLGGVLIPTQHARGAAIAAVVADIVLCGSIYVFVWRAGAARAFQARPFVRIAVCAVPGIVIALLSPLPDAVNCVLAASAYVVLTGPLGALPPEISDRIRSLLHRRGRRQGSPPATTRSST